MKHPVTVGHYTDKEVPIPVSHPTASSITYGPPLKPARVRVEACLAASMDGKISACFEPDQHSGYVRLGSDADIARLKACRDNTDAILFGGETLRAFPKLRKGQHRTTPLPHYILTRGHQLDWTQPWISQALDTQTPVWIVSSQPKPPPCPTHIHWMTLPTDSPPHQWIPKLLVHMFNQGHHSLLVEGGGTVIHQFLQARVLERLYLTLTPWLIGGDHTLPSLVSGPGVPLSQAPRTHIESSDILNDELHLTLALTYPQSH